MAPPEWHRNMKAEVASAGSFREVLEMLFSAGKDQGSRTKKRKVLYMKPFTYTAESGFNYYDNWLAPADVLVLREAIQEWLDKHPGFGDSVFDPSPDAELRVAKEALAGEVGPRGYFLVWYLFDDQVTIPKPPPLGDLKSEEDRKKAAEEVWNKIRGGDAFGWAPTVVFPDGTEPVDEEAKTLVLPEEESVDEEAKTLIVGREGEGASPGDDEFVEFKVPELVAVSTAAPTAEEKATIGAILDKWREFSSALDKTFTGSDSTMQADLKRLREGDKDTDALDEVLDNITAIDTLQLNWAQVSSEGEAFVAKLIRAGKGVDERFSEQKAVIGEQLAKGQILRTQFAQLRDEIEKKLRKDGDGAESVASDASDGSTGSSSGGWSLGGAVQWLMSFRGKGASGDDGRAAEFLSKRDTTITGYETEIRKREELFGQYLAAFRDATIEASDMEVKAIQDRLVRKMRELDDMAAAMRAVYMLPMPEGTKPELVHIDRQKQTIRLEAALRRLTDLHKALDVLHSKLDEAVAAPAPASASDSAAASASSAPAPGRLAKLKSWAGRVASAFNPLAYGAASKSGKAAKSTHAKGLAPRAPPNLARDAHVLTLLAALSV